MRSAAIKCDLFALQNHLIVKVPPYHDQQITSAVSVGIYVVTNAGRSHDVQPFTYTPEPGVWLLWGRSGHFTSQPSVPAAAVLSNVALSKPLLLASVALFIIQCKGFAFLIYAPHTSKSSCLVTALLV